MSIYMGQTMAECDCTCPACEPRGYCMADRIEELEAKLATCEKYRDAYAEMDRIGTEAVRDLEAKLAKAVEALEKLERRQDCLETFDAVVDEIVTTTLAELKGDT